MFVAFMLGLTGSFSHCAGMCGPIAALLSRRASVTQSKSALILLHLGRISSYSLFGLLAGGFGQAAGLGMPVLRQVQGVLALLAANVALYLALSVLGWMPSPEKLLSGWVRRWGTTMRATTLSTSRPGLLAPYGLGLLWGLLPCGMVIAALFIAVTSANALGGALNMLAFGVGTLPALLVARWLAGWTFRPTWPRYASAAILILFGLQFALRGLSAWGVVGHMMVGEWMLW